MWSRPRGALLFLTLQWSFLGSLSIQLWSSPDALPTSIPARCRAALSQNITCSPNLVSARFVAGGRALDNATLIQYCTTSCHESLQNFKTDVDTSCGNTLYQMFVNSTMQQSGAAVADPLAWAYNVTCIADDTRFCLPALYNGTKAPCSDCSLKYGAAMLGSDYGRVRVQPNAFSSLLSSCGAPASKYSYTYASTSSGSSTSTSTSAPKATCTGTPYTVGPQDTCQSIAQAKSIAIDRLISGNGLDYNCSSLTPGSTLCLGPSCTLQTIQPNQTCGNITANQKFTSIQLISWNPTIHAGCDNLDAMVGRCICVSPPGSLDYNPTLLNTSTATMSSMFPGPWRTGSIATAPPTISTSWYNLQTAFIPPPTQTITANLTAASLIAARTSYCPITDEDYANGFEEADLPDACEAIIEPYCWPNPDAPILTSTTFPAACTPNRSSATATSATTAVDSLTSVQSPTSVQSSTSVANPVPSPLEPNTTANCKQYYQVLNGDNCYSIANNSKITLDQFYAWNPYVGTDCAKLFLGYYVCIAA